MLHVRLESRLGIPICSSEVFARVKAGEQSRRIKGLRTVGPMDLQTLKTRVKDTRVQMKTSVRRDAAVDRNDFSLHSSRNKLVRPAYTHPVNVSLSAE